MTGTSQARPAREPADRGMVTVETAICLGGVLIVLALVLAGLSTLLGQIQCTDAAREAARLVARGETDQAKQIAAKIAPGGATVTITVTGDTVAVLIAAQPVGGLLPGVTMHAQAYAVREPQPPDDPPTTAQPTTAQPTTAQPTTMPPTTAPPTTKGKG